MPSSKPLKIGLLAPQIRGINGEGGIASHFADLAAGLIALGHNVRAVVAVDGPAPPGLPADLDGLRVIRIPSTMPRWLHECTRWRWRAHVLAGLWHRSRRAAQALNEAHDSEPFDAIETTSSGLMAMAYLKVRIRAPIATRVSTLARQLVHHGSGSSPAWNERREDAWEKKMVERSDVILTHTQEHKGEIAREWRLPASSIRVIPHGIALPNAAELRAGVSGQRKRLLFIGRCERRKGIQVLLRALPAVLAAMPTTDCEIIGKDEGDYWQGWWKRESPGELQTRVRFSGPLSDREVQRAYRDCDLFVAPSLYESFGLIYLEAMAWGKAVVGGRCGGVPEVVADGETGRLVEPGDVAALTRALIELLGNDAIRAEWGRAGRRRVEALFSRPRLALASAELYAEMAAARP